jgi:hypothetical protein
LELGEGAKALWRLRAACSLRISSTPPQSVPSTSAAYKSLENFLLGKKNSNKTPIFLGTLTFDRLQIQLTKYLGIAEASRKKLLRGNFAKKSLRIRKSEKRDTCEAHYRGKTGYLKDVRCDGSNLGL